MVLLINGDSAEIIGTVAAVPDTEKEWKEGDRVGGPWHGGHDGKSFGALEVGIIRLLRKEERCQWNTSTFGASCAGTGDFLSLTWARDLQTLQTWPVPDVQE